MKNTYILLYNAKYDDKIIINNAIYTIKYIFENDNSKRKYNGNIFRSLYQ